MFRTDPREGAVPCAETRLSVPSVTERPREPLAPRALFHKRSRRATRWRITRRWITRAAVRFAPQNARGAPCRLIHVKDVRTCCVRLEADGERERRDRAWMIVRHAVRDPPDGERDRKDERQGIDIPPTFNRAQTGRIAVEVQPGGAQSSDDATE